MEVENAEVKNEEKVSSEAVGTQKHINRLALIIAMLCIVILAFAVTLAWFIVSERVNANDVETTAALSPITLTYEQGASEQMDFEHYMGQTGREPLGELDAPYIASYDVSFTGAINGGSGKLFVDFKALSILRKGNIVVENADLSEFSLRILDKDNNKCYVKNAGGIYVNEKNPLEILTVESGATRKLTVEIIFLSEESYAKWLEEDYDYNDFFYSDPTYMGVTFEFKLTYTLTMGGA